MIIAETSFVYHRIVFMFSMPLRVDHQPPSMKLPKSIGNFHQNELSSSNNRSSPTRGKGGKPQHTPQGGHKALIEGCAGS